MFVRRHAPAHEFMSGDFTERIISPVENGECSEEETERKIHTWRELGKFSVFTAGAYDLLQLNHMRGLVQCRALGAMALLEIDKIRTDLDRREVHKLAASSDIGLMVTMDTNRALEEGKSRRAEKGGAPKPTLDWQTRAIMLASQSLPTPDYDQRVDLVDYITRHGPGCCGSCEDGTCINEDNARMAVSLQPNMVVVNTTSRQTIADLTRYKEDGLLPSTHLVEFEEQEGAYHDAVLDGQISTTSIINRIRS